MLSINRSRGYSIISVILTAYAISPRPSYSISFPKNTKNQARTHNRSGEDTNKINAQCYPPNVNCGSFSALDEEEYNSSAFDAILPKTASEFLLASLPAINTVVAFNTFEGTSDAFGKLIAFLSASSDNPTCNMEGASNVANGIVVASIALLFATMAEVTVSSLRQVSNFRSVIRHDMRLRNAF